MTHTFFDTYHPSVAFVFFVIMIIFCMVAMQPVYLLISFLASVGCRIVFCGTKKALESAAWSVPIIGFLAVVNPLFSASGSTELFKIGVRAFYFESMVYGACMGLMLVSMMQWFAVASRILTSDKVTALFGNTIPTIGLMITMVLRLVPRFLGRGAEIGLVQKACTSVPASKGGDTASSHMRTVSVLMGWGMEDSLETADAMRARGWGAVAGRSTYARWRLKSRDVAFLCGWGVLALCNLFLSLIACSQFVFYPTLSHVVLWWGYIPFVVLAVSPIAFELKERARWKQ